MYNFFVLGQIPGTSFVITFNMWVELFALLASLVALVAVHRAQVLKSYAPATISSEATNR